MDGWISRKRDKLMVSFRNYPTVDTNVTHLSISSVIHLGNRFLVCWLLCLVRIPHFLFSVSYPFLTFPFVSLTWNGSDRCIMSRLSSISLPHLANSNESCPKNLIDFLLPFLRPYRPRHPSKTPSLTQSTLTSLHFLLLNMNHIPSRSYLCTWRHIFFQPNQTCTTCWMWSPSPTTPLLRTLILRPQVS